MIADRPAAAAAARGRATRPSRPAAEAIVRKCLAPDPADRYQRAEHLREDLDRQLAPPAAEARPEPVGRGSGCGSGPGGTRGWRRPATVRRGRRRPAGRRSGRRAVVARERSRDLDARAQLRRPPGRVRRRPGVPRRPQPVAPAARRGARPSSAACSTGTACPRTAPATRWLAGPGRRGACPTADRDRLRAGRRRGVLPDGPGRRTRGRPRADPASEAAPARAGRRGGTRRPSGTPATGCRGRSASSGRRWPSCAGDAASAERLRGEAGRDAGRVAPRPATCSAWALAHAGPATATPCRTCGGHAARPASTSRRGSSAAPSTWPWSRTSWRRCASRRALALRDGLRPGVAQPRAGVHPAAVLRPGAATTTTGPSGSTRPWPRPTSSGPATARPPATGRGPRPTTPWRSTPARRRCGSTSCGRPSATSSATRPGPPPTAPRGFRSTPTDELSWVGPGRDPRSATTRRRALADVEEALKLNPASVYGAATEGAHPGRAAGPAGGRGRPVLDRAVELYPDYAPARAGRGVRAGPRAASTTRPARTRGRRCSATRRPPNLYQVACIYALTSKDDPDDRAEAFRLLSVAPHRVRAGHRGHRPGPRPAARGGEVQGGRGRRPRRPRSDEKAGP